MQLIVPQFCRLLNSSHFVTKSSATRFSFLESPIPSSTNFARQIFQFRYFPERPIWTIICDVDSRARAEKNDNKLKTCKFGSRAFALLACYAMNLPPCDLMAEKVGDAALSFVAASRWYDGAFDAVTFRLETKSEKSFK